MFARHPACDNFFFLRGVSLLRLGQVDHGVCVRPAQSSPRTGVYAPRRGTDAAESEKRGEVGMCVRCVCSLPGCGASEPVFLEHHLLLPKLGIRGVHRRRILGGFGQSRGCGCGRGGGRNNGSSVLDMSKHPTEER